MKKDPKTRYWIVNELIDSHINCSHTYRNLSVKLINKSKHNKAIVLPGSNPKTMSENSTELGFNGISNAKFYRAMKKKVNSVENFSDGFNYIESYVMNVFELNPCSIIELQYYLDNDGKRRFGRLFTTLRSMIEAVVIGCKPVISFDACFTKTELWGKYQILVAGKFYSMMNIFFNIFL